MLKKLVASVGIGGGGTVLAGGSLATHNYVSNAPQPETRSDNGFYKKVTTQLFKLDGTLVEQKFFKSGESCGFCSQDPYDKKLYLRVIWERPSNVDWFGASKYESWYEIKQGQWSFFAAKDSYSVFWTILTSDNVIEKRDIEIPDVLKSETLTDQGLVRYL